MEKSDKEYFEELLAKVPDDVARLVDRQMEISVAIADAIDRSEYKNRKEFAQAIGMKPSMLSRILSGNVNLTLKTITKIETALKTDIIHVEELKYEESKKKPDYLPEFSQFIFKISSNLFDIRNNQNTETEIFDIETLTNSNLNQRDIHVAIA